MKKIHSIVSLASLTLLSTACQQEQKKQENIVPPNIIFLVSEDNSPFLGSYGDDNAYTPNLDRLASQGILYENAFAVAPVCAPSRSSIITGMYANSLGSHHMRSEVAIPDDFRFFPYYLRQAGYYTTNRLKKDYNIIDQDEVWDDSKWWDYEDMLRDRKEDQPFFVMFNTFMSHEQRLHDDRETRVISYYRDAAIESMTGTPASQERIDYFNHMHQPGSIPLPPYHPDVPEMHEDWARYYDCISMMDDEIGEMLKNLDRDGLLENTIIFYFSDHGGVVGRSKRFPFESGLKVPLIVRVPEKYQHMIAHEPGSRTDRVVTLMDLAPTVLHLAGIDIPEQFQGIPFLGSQAQREREYAFGFRGRMDERYDFSRTARDKDYRYIRNYMPHRPWGQKVNYLWNAPHMHAWEQAWLEGETNAQQSYFFEPKAVEELFNIHNDPHNVNNLATDPNYQDVLVRMRSATDDWMLRINDKNFIPEGEYLAQLNDRIGFEYYTGDNYDIEAIKKIADVAIVGKSENLSSLKEALQSENAVVRYWGALGCCVLKQEALPLKQNLLTVLDDVSPDVRITAAEALYFMGSKSEAKETLKDILQVQHFVRFGAEEALRTHALNVVTLMNNDDIAFFTQEIKALVNRDEGGYDKRVAEYLLDRMHN